MTGARLASYRGGDRAELLVEFFLHALAFTTPVLRQEDVGHDFLCALAEPHENMVWAGPSFAVQVKSDASPLVFDKEYELQWLIEQENPFFLAVGIKAEMRVDLYSTWQRVRAFLQHGKRKTTLSFDQPPNPSLPVELSKDGTEQTVHLGEPIISLSLEQLLDEATRDRARNVLRRWIEVDRANIVSSRVGIHLTVGPHTYKRNVSPSLELMQVGLYWNSQNLGKCVENLLRAATLLRLTLAVTPGIGSPRLDAEKLESLESLLRAWEDAIDPGLKETLSKFAPIAMKQGQI